MRLRANLFFKMFIYFFDSRFQRPAEKLVFAVKKNKISYILRVFTNFGFPVPFKYRFDNFQSHWSPPDEGLTIMKNLFIMLVHNVQLCSELNSFEAPGLAQRLGDLFLNKAHFICHVNTFLCLFKNFFYFLYTSYSIYVLKHTNNYLDIQEKTWLRMTKNINSG